VFEIQISATELGRVDELLDALTGDLSSVEDPDFQREAAVHAHRLPEGLRRELVRFRLTEASGACLVRGLRIDEERIGPTPNHWSERQPVSPALREEVFFYLCAQLLGDPVAWATEQNGYVMHDILPVRGHEQEHIDSGSEVLLTWHTEVAFHPFRADYVALMCLRNPDAVETTFADLTDLDIPEEDRRILFQDRFVIRPDEIHLNRDRSSVNRGTQELSALIEESYQWVRAMDENPVPGPILSGNRRRPYLCIDPYSMDEPLDDEARTAFKNLCAEIERNIQPLALSPGDIVFIDNFRSVHGRRPFKARFDGTDRWLKRLNIARDLRKSSRARLTADSRIIY
jgi:Fe(II)/alpha-ketoglutarate-dependent arginine beta-hydroxylase